MDERNLYKNLKKTILCIFILNYCILLTGAIIFYTLLQLLTFCSRYQCNANKLTPLQNIYANYDKINNITRTSHKLKPPQSRWTLRGNMHKIYNFTFNTFQYTQKYCQPLADSAKIPLSRLPPLRGCR